ncbi:hypothetical protein [Robbsia andropogonis]|uniref:hypothetical protein n=1 Tax=Robbsia andropogonis TaxID=28092 RepID=UPI0020A1F6FB|nr:hypothetical protein [Robbsia andropogonis]MCP1117020.1 hypothetical protein [Robbsia andropogonis]MCP1126301.1 hypothetical protein [Robbsia andropogonis]
MKKLTEKIKYKMVDGHAELYARRKGEMSFSLLGTCHASCIDVIQRNGDAGLKEVIDNGCIRFA